MNCSNLTRCMIVCLALLLVTAFITVDAYAAKHGAGAIKSAAPCKEPGQNAENLIEVVYLDEFGDVLQVLEGFDVIKAGGGDVEIRNLPISNKSGNAKCCGSDATPVTPCYIGPAGSTLAVPGSVTGCGNLTLPGAGTPGRVEFISDTYVIEPGDAPVLDDDGKIRWNDLCTAGASGCSFAEQIATAGASTSVCVQDANLCDTESCQDTNDDQIPDACLGTPITCNDADACTTDTCNDASGCVYTPISCDDSNACTADACDPASGCTHSAISCNDSNACTTDTCVPATGCVYTPDVVCNDGNACTTDACVPATGCVYTADVVCNDNSVCTTDTCDPATGCVYTDITCDDGDICTDDTCDPATGCVYTPDPTNDPSCAEGCLTRTPGFWCTHDAVTKQYLNIEVCGTTLNNVNAGNTHSTIEAMGGLGNDNKKLNSPQLLMLIRQCSAAALNFKATLEGGGNCSNEDVMDSGETIAEVFDACCDSCSVCTGQEGDISACNNKLDWFNNLNGDYDTLNCDTMDTESLTYSIFCPSLGANGYAPTSDKPCQNAKNNGFVVYPGVCE